MSRSRAALARWLAGLLLLALPCWIGVARAQAEDEPLPMVRVQDAYIEMHTGMGREYPVFYVAKRGEWVQVVVHRTQWFKVRTRRLKEGWVHESELFGSLIGIMDLPPVRVVDPYVQLLSAPGQRYSLVYRARQGEWLIIRKRRTDWFLVRTAKGTEGWVSLVQLQNSFRAADLTIAANDAAATPRQAVGGRAGGRRPAVAAP